MRCVFNFTQVDSQAQLAHAMCYPCASKTHKPFASEAS